MARRTRIYEGKAKILYAGAAARHLDSVFQR